MSVFLLPDTLAGERVDAAVARVSGYSRSRIDSLIEAGAVHVNGATVTNDAGSVVWLITDT